MVVDDDVSTVGVDNLTPGNDVAASHPLEGTGSTDSEPLENGLAPDDETDDLEPAVREATPDVVNASERRAGLGPHLGAQ
jgi:hypothetical protein